MADTTSPTAPAEPAPSMASPALRAYALVWTIPAVVMVPLGVWGAIQAPAEALLWLVVATAANLLALPILPRLNFVVTMGAPVNIAAAVVLGPPVAVLVTGLGLTTPNQIRREVDVWAIAFNRAQIGLSAGLASWVVQAGELMSNRIVATLVAALVYSIVNTIAVAGWLRLKRGVRLGAAARGATAPIPRFAVDFALVALLALFVVIVEQDLGAPALLMLALPLWLGYSALRSARESEDRAEQLAARVRELETFSTASTDLLSAHDPQRVEAIGCEAVQTALATSDVAVSVGGDIPAHLQAIKISGFEPAAVGVPQDAEDGAIASVEAIAGLLGLALTRLQLEQELQEVQRARAALSGRILEEGTRERSRIALEIHDEVLPYLAAAEIQADNVRSALDEGAHDRADDLAVRMRGAIHDGIARLRDVLEALRQQIVVPGQLRPALEEALTELRLKHGIEGRLAAPDPLPPLPFPVEILLLETVRGCLTNVARHAEACHVDVAVETSERAVRVSVADNGVGFDPTVVPEGHHGLALMQQRVELGRGRFTVDSAPGRGTTVEMVVPL